MGGGNVFKKIETETKSGFKKLDKEVLKPSYDVVEDVITAPVKYPYEWMKQGLDSLLGKGGGGGGDTAGSAVADSGQFESDVQGIRRRRLSSARGYLSTIRRGNSETKRSNLLATGEQQKSTLG